MKDVEIELKKCGFYILNEYKDKKHIHVIDKKGYKYIVQFHNIVKLKQKACPFHKSNPYTLENIQNYLNNYSPTSIVISTEYIDNNNYLDFKCNMCGEIYHRPLRKMQECKYKVCEKCQRQISAKNQAKSYDEVCYAFKECGYNVLDNEYKNNSTPIECEDKYGYRYKISLQNIKKGKSPRMFSFSSNFDDCYFNLNKFISNNHLYNKVVKVYDNGKAEFICECGNKFKTDVYRFISGEKRRCEKCTKKISGLELKVMNFLKENNVNFEYQYSYNDCKNKRLMPFDFYLNDYNTCIEVDGDQHFHCAFINEKEKALINLEKTQKNDRKKEQYCLDNNINLIRIPYWRIKSGKFKEILFQLINTN